jgi:hypothetical protein
MMRGEKATTYQRYGMLSGPRTTYNNPVTRGYGNPALRPGPPPPAARSVRSSQENLIFASRAEASSVIAQMSDIIDQYEVASVADLNIIVGLATSHTDNVWGWEYFGNAQVREVREGFLLDLPPAQPIR